MGDTIIKIINEIDGYMVKNDADFQENMQLKLQNYKFLWYYTDVNDE